MFARATTFHGTPDSVDGATRFPIRTVSKGVDELPGFLGIFDLVDRKGGRSVVLTLWATEDARAASAEFGRDAANRAAEEGGEQVISVEEYEVGYYIIGNGLFETAREDSAGSRGSAT